jgi:hypothetical protein
MLLASCGRHVSLADLPAPLQVDQPSTCEEVLAPVPVPTFGPEADAIEAYLAMEATAITASAEVDLGRECIARQRQGYAGKGGN